LAAVFGLPKAVDTPDFHFSGLTSYGPHARATWTPDLHLALWNPYQALDFAAPALMTYGFAPPALEAVQAWLAGDIEAEGHCPVPGF